VAGGKNKKNVQVPAKIRDYDWLKNRIPSSFGIGIGRGTISKIPTTITMHTTSKKNQNR
jgi:hypothetical protein